MAQSGSGSGLIALAPVDAKVRARGVCRYSVANGMVKADVSASQIYGEDDYIAIIMIEGRPVPLGSLESAPGGWRAGGEALGKTADAAFVGISDGSGLSIILAGKRMGAELELMDAMQRVRMSFMVTASKAKKPEEPAKKAAEAPAGVAAMPEAPEAEEKAPVPKDEAPVLDEMPEVLTIFDEIPEPVQKAPKRGHDIEAPGETAPEAQRISGPEAPILDVAEEGAIRTADSPAAMGDDNAIRLPASLDRFVTGGEARSITDMPVSKAGPGGDGSAMNAFLDAPCCPPEDEDVSPPPLFGKGRRIPLPNELLRSARPSYVRGVSSPFPGQYPGSVWVITSYPGALYPHYLAARWRRGAREILISAVPGEYAPSPPPWLGGFSRHLVARWGQGYWLNFSDYATGQALD